MTMTEKLDMLMKEKGINQRQLSLQTGIPYSTISNWYKDQEKASNAKLGALTKLASYFDVSLDYIADNSVDDRRYGMKDDSNDVSDDIDSVLEKLEAQPEGLMFCGKPMDDETKRLLKLSLEHVKRLATEMDKAEGK